MRLPSLLRMRKHRNHGKPWTPEEDHILRTLSASGSTLIEIARRLERTQESVRTRANVLRIPVSSGPRQKLSLRLSIG